MFESWMPLCHSAHTGKAPKVSCVCNGCQLMVKRRLKLHLPSSEMSACKLSSQTCQHRQCRLIPADSNVGHHRRCKVQLVCCFSV